MKTLRALAVFLLLTGFLPALASAQSYYYPTTTGGITRASFVQMVMQETGTLYYDGTNCFTDVKTQSYAPYVCAAKQQGIVTGGPDGRFRPDDLVTFIEASAMIIRAEGVRVPTSATWYQPYLEQMNKWDAIPSSVTNIATPITQAQAREMIDAVMDRDDDDDDKKDNGNDVLKLTIDVSDSTVEPGDTITFKIRIKNTDNDDLENIDVKAELDDDMDYVSSSDDGYLRSGDQVRWNDIDVDENKTKTLTLTIRANRDLDDGDSIKLKVTAEGKTVSKTVKIDDDDDDDDDDLRISITDSSDPVEAGGTLMYKIRLENRGDDDIRADVTAFLDDDMDFVSASDGGDEERDEVEWNNIRLDEDELRTLTLTVRIDKHAKNGDTVTLRVKANDEEDTENTKIRSDDDDDDGDDEDVTITISDSPDPAEPGDEVTYTIKIKNNENHDISIDVRAEFDNDFASFLSATSGGDLEGSDTVEWDDLEIDEDETRTIKLTLRIKSSADDGDTLKVKVEGGDDEDTESTKIED